MAVSRPPISEQAFEDFSKESFERSTAQMQTDLAALQARQEQVDQAAEQDFTQRAQAQVAAGMEPHRQATERLNFVQAAQAQVQSLFDRLPQPGRVLAAGPTAPAMPQATGAPQGSGGGLGRVYQDALASGLDEEGARAAVAVAATEGGMTGTRGDVDIGGCYDAETRVLVRRGFVHWPEVTEDDEFATRRMDGLIEYHRPLALQRYRHDGEMYRLRNRSIDLLITPNHNILAWPHNAGPSALGLRPVASMVPTSRTRKGIKNGQTSGRARNWRIPVHSRWLGEPVTEGPAYAAFLGLYVAEGHAQTARRDRPDSSANQITITQTENARIGSIRRVLADAGLVAREFRYVHANPNYAPKVNFRVTDRVLNRALRPLGKTRDKHVPRHLLMAGPEVLSALLTGLMLGDGHAARPWYTTTSPQLADDVAEIAIKLGYGVAMVRNRIADPRQADQLRVVLKSAEQYELDLARQMEIIPDWSGEVYCATVPNHTLLVERGGKVTWCGNSRGTFQLYFGGGMGNAYARARGISEQQADAELAADPHSANRWALGGYLGQAIREGMAKGLRGPDLATFAQRYGQRSVSPERAGANYAGAVAAIGAPQTIQDARETVPRPPTASGGVFGAADPADAGFAAADAVSAATETGPPAAWGTLGQLGGLGGVPGVPGSSGDTSGERPPSEFEPAPVPPAPDILQTAGALGRLALPALTGQYGAMGGPAVQADTGVLREQMERAAAEQERARATFTTLPQDRPWLPEERARALEAVEPTALALTPEPLAGVGGKVVAAAAGEVARLRLDKFPEAVRDTIQAAAEDAGFWRTQRRGVIPDAEAERMADRLGRSVDQLIAGGRAGRAYNTEETRALRNAVTAQAMTVNELAEEIARAPHEAGPGLIARSIAEGMKLADLTRIAEGGRAEAGRALRVYQAFARDYAASPAGAIERIQKAVGGPEHAAKAIAEYHKMLLDGAGPAQMAAFWARAEKPPVGALEWWELLRRNSMLSGPRTLAINALSGATEVPWKLAGDTLESVLSGRPHEIVPEVKAIWAGLTRGSEHAVQTLAHGITEEAARAGDLPRDISSRLTNPAARGAALALEAPMRAQQATDEVVQGVAYAMHLSRDAARTASKEGLKGAAWNERVADLMASPSADAMKRATAGAEAMTFKGEMGTLGTAIGQFQKVPIIGPMVIPFLRTVYHITARGIDRSPLGLVGTGIDVARGVYRGGKELPRGVRPLGERFRDNLMGSAASVWFYDQALKGNITGAGPDDPEKRAMLQAQGWQPYAVKLGGTYVGYQNWGPIAVPLSLMAGAAEAQTYAKPGTTPAGMVGDALQRSVKVLTEQNYLQGVGAIYKSMTDFDRYGHQWLTQYLTSLVPYGAAINTLGQATDPLVRQPAKGDVAGALAARFPGLREEEPAKRDVLGRDVVNEQLGLAAANPLRTTEGRPDETLRVLLENGADIPAPPKEIRGVPLTPDDQRRHQEMAGAAMADAVARVTANPRFAELPADTRKKILSNVVEQAREQAAGRLFKELGSPEISRRMREKQAVGTAR